MGLFIHEKGLPLPEIIERLIAGVNEAFIAAEDAGESDVRLKELSVCLQVKIRDLQTYAAASKVTDGPFTYDDLKFMLDRIEADGDRFTVNILFQQK